MYLGASIQKLETADSMECWMMSEEKYIKAAVENVKLKLAKSNCSLLSRCNTPMATTYYPSEEVKKEIYSEVLQVYQELIGTLQLAVNIARVYILLEVYLL